MNNEPLAFITALGDKALFVLMILKAIGQSISRKRLLSLTGYSGDTLDKSIGRLDEFGLLVARQSLRSGYCALPDKTRQIVLGEIERIETLEKMTPNFGVSPHGVVVDPPLLDSGIQQQQTHSQKTPKIGVCDESLRAEYLAALIEGRVWPRIAAPLAEKLAGGQIPLTPGEIRAWTRALAADREVRNPGALLRYHVERGASPPLTNQRKDYLA